MSFRIALLASACIIGVSEMSAAAASDEAKPSKIETVVVTAKRTSAGDVYGYRAASAGSATRTNTPLREIPQSISVIPRSVIDDQMNLTLGEAVRNASGTQATNPVQTPAYQSGLVRGFPAEQWVDGFTNYYGAGDRDSLVNAERIEVLKGPNAILYGGGAGAPLGGVINVVSKLPLTDAFANLGITGGSYNYINVWADGGTPLTDDGRLLSRLTAEFVSSESFINVIHNQRYSINPTLSYSDGDNTVVLQGHFTDWRQQEYQGLPATGTITGPFHIDPHLFIGPANMPSSYSREQSAVITATHRFDDVWQVTLQAKFGHTVFDELAQDIYGTDFAANAPSFPPTQWNVYNLDLFQKQDDISVNGTVTATFDSAWGHTVVLAGGDYSHLTDDGAMYGDLNDLVLLGTVDLTNPVFPAYVRPPRTPPNTIVDGVNGYTTAGGFIQVQTTFWNQLHLLGGLRVAHLEIDSVSPTYLMSSKTDTTEVLPRIGLVEDVTDGISLFADYSEGLKGNPFVFYAGTPEPEHSRQVEAGVKFLFAPELSGTASLFQIERSGVPESLGLLSAPIGEQRSRGFDVDVIWQPDPHWQLLANYAYIDAVLTNTTAAGPTGNALNLVTPHSGRIWVNYRFSGTPDRGWSIGAGLTAASGAYLDLTNIYKTKAYATIDARIGYDAEDFAAGVSLKNLTDESYFIPFNYFNGRIAPGDPLQVFASFTLKIH